MWNLPTLTNPLSCAAVSDTGTGMNSVVSKINRIIYKDYPFYKGVKPKVSERSNGELLLVYEKNEMTEDGFPIPLQLRVRANADGTIRSVAGSK